MSESPRFPDSIPDATNSDGDRSPEPTVLALAPTLEAIARQLELLVEQYERLYRQRDFELQQKYGAQSFFHWDQYAPQHRHPHAV